MRLAGSRLRAHHSRKGLTKPSKGGPVWNGEVRLNVSWLDQPQLWNRPRHIFVCAHGDLFYEKVPNEWIDMVFRVMSDCPQHTFQVLTKRPERMLSYLTDPERRFPHQTCSGDGCNYCGGFEGSVPWKGYELPNVWLGVSCERQEEADQRIPILLNTPAAVRFISAEPLIGPIDASKFMWPVCGWWKSSKYRTYEQAKAAGDECGLDRQRLVHADRVFLDWVIAGGESGPGARDMYPEWMGSLRDQCEAAHVPFFAKQMAHKHPIPPDLVVRQFPAQKKSRR
jgi:protein gp37